ncbi:hypothetical protein DWX17_19285 [[Clostridium] innocuum]|nr:hypothetical protein DWX17_19285 [[Clostridium] innocuum]
MSVQPVYLFENEAVFFSYAERYKSFAHQHLLILHLWDLIQEIPKALAPFFRYFLKRIQKRKIL